MICRGTPALVLAPMDGITDPAMRDFQGTFGSFSYAVTEFIRVSVVALPSKVFRRDVPELSTGGKTLSGLPVQIQILGGDPEKMAATAVSAVKAGATSIDINFGCPAPTVNRNDGGASLLKDPCRLREIVHEVRQAVPKSVAVSAKLRLGWDTIESIHENAAMAAEGGASWLTIHARTRVQGYQPPVFWPSIGKVQSDLGLPIVANGDIWTFEDFLQCRDETGSEHFMIGRGALANPSLSMQIAQELGIFKGKSLEWDWVTLLRGMAKLSDHYADRPSRKSIFRLKQWLKLASTYGDFRHFDAIKHCVTLEEFFPILEGLLGSNKEEVSEIAV